MRSLSRLLPFLLLVGAASPVRVAAQAACGPALVDAEEAYLEGRFDRATELLAACLEGAEAPAPDLIRAHRLLALAAINQGDAPGARQAIEGLLAVAPDYEPDPVQDPPSYTVLALIVKDQVEQERAAQAAAEAEAQRPWLAKRGTWLLVGAGIVAVGVIAVVAGGGAE